MSLSEQIQRVDGSQNDILKTILKSFGVTIGEEKIDAIANLAKIASNLQADGILSVSTKTSFNLAENATPNDVFSILSKAALFSDGELKLPNGSQISQAEILYGSYRGTGSGTQVTLTFPFPPDIVIIVAEDMSIYYGGIFIKGGNKSMLLLSSAIDLPYYFSEKNLVLNREMGDPSMALNSPVNYYYVAIKSN